MRENDELEIFLARVRPRFGLRFLRRCNWRIVKFVSLQQFLREFFFFFILPIQVVAHLLVESDCSLVFDRLTTQHLLYFINNKFNSLTHINQSGVLWVFWAFGLWGIPNL